MNPMESLLGSKGTIASKKRSSMSLPEDPAALGGALGESYDTSALEVAERPAQSYGQQGGSVTQGGSLLSSIGYGVSSFAPALVSESSTERNLAYTGLAGMGVSAVGQIVGSQLLADAGSYLATGAGLARDISRGETEKAAVSLAPKAIQYGGQAALEVGNLMGNATVSAVGQGAMSAASVPYALYSTAADIGGRVLEKNAEYPWQETMGRSMQVQAQPYGIGYQYIKEGLGEKSGADYTTLQNAFSPGSPVKSLFVDYDIPKTGKWFATTGASALKGTKFEAPASVLNPLGSVIADVQKGDFKSALTTAFTGGLANVFSSVFGSHKAPRMPAFLQQIYNNQDQYVTEAKLQEIISNGGNLTWSTKNPAMIWIADPANMERLVREHPGVMDARSNHLDSWIRDFYPEDYNRIKGLISSAKYEPFSLGGGEGGG